MLLPTTMQASLIILIFHFIVQVGAFTIQPFASSPFKTQLQAGPSSAEELISSPDIWDPIKQELDKIPVFGCTNDKGQPLQYNIGDKPLGVFFCDVNAAKVELEKAQADTKLDGLQILPFPLGEVFEMGAKQMAVVVPSAQALEEAGAPKGLNPLGQQVPMFGCMEISADQPDGTSRTPLFMSFDEAEAVMKMAVDGIGAGEDSKFEVTVMPLVKAVQNMATNPEKSYIFEAPKSSLEYLRNSMN